MFTQRTLASPVETPKPKPLRGVHTAVVALPPDAPPARSKAAQQHTSPQPGSRRFRPISNQSPTAVFERSKKKAKCHCSPVRNASASSSRSSRPATPKSKSSPSAPSKTPSRTSPKSTSHKSKEPSPSSKSHTTPSAPSIHSRASASPNTPNSASPCSECCNHTPSVHSTTSKESPMKVLSASNAPSLLGETELGSGDIDRLRTSNAALNAYRRAALNSSTDKALMDHTTHQLLSEFEQLKQIRAFDRFSSTQHQQQSIESPNDVAEELATTLFNYVIQNFNGIQLSNGLMLAELTRFPRIYPSPHHLESPCAICHFPFEACDRLLLLPCKHAYHEHCIERWLQQQATCPTCRYQIQATASQEENITRGASSPRPGPPVIPPLTGFGSSSSDEDADESPKTMAANPPILGYNLVTRELSDEMSAEMSRADEVNAELSRGSIASENSAFRSPRAFNSPLSAFSSPRNQPPPPVSAVASVQSILFSVPDSEL